MRLKATSQIDRVWKSDVPVLVRFGYSVQVDDLKPEGLWVVSV